MKISTITADANINAPAVNLVSLGGTSPEASAKGFWKSLVTRFWDHTEELGKADMKSFEGLL